MNNVSPETVKLIFGLKVNQLRQQKDLSFAQLSEKTGMSVSYLNEIEKGKKYPKTDKIMALAEAFDVPYDELVSLQLGAKLNPVSDLLASNFLNEVPFDFFGISQMSLLEMLANAPAKVSAFIKTIVDIGRNYNLTVEQFYFAVLRSYQELHLNYFPELEEKAAEFISEFGVDKVSHTDEFFLSNVLSERFGVELKYFDEKDYPSLALIRSVYQPKRQVLLINKNINAEQRAFTILREIGFLYMNLKERPLTSSWVEVNSFEEVLNNFKASYFAGSILIRREPLLKEMDYLFGLEKWYPEHISLLLKRFEVTPETFLHRVSNLLSEHFGVTDYYFLRFEATQGQQDYKLTKEMHMSSKNEPHATQKEHYCRRWQALRMLDTVSDLVEKGEYTAPLIGCQHSVYHNDGSEYFVITLARPLNLNKYTNVSVTIGFELNDKLRQTMKFVDDPAVPVRQVNLTCERCGIFDCKERVAAPTILQRERYTKDLKATLAQLR